MRLPFSASVACLNTKRRGSGYWMVRNRRRGRDWEAEGQGQAKEMEFSQNGDLNQQLWLLLCVWGGVVVVQGPPGGWRDAGLRLRRQVPCRQPCEVSTLARRSALLSSRPLEKISLLGTVMAPQGRWDRAVVPRNPSSRQ